MEEEGAIAASWAVVPPLSCPLATLSSGGSMTMASIRSVERIEAISQVEWLAGI
jgi:hypothetical protein